MKRMPASHFFAQRTLRDMLRHHLYRDGDTMLVGVSGGADSVALLCVLHELEIPVIAAHCNFGLRGEESVRDENFVTALCQRLGIPLQKTVFDTRGVAKAQGISIEMAARQLRYTYFETLRTTLNCRCIAVGHHREDNAETLLLNLLRGTGIKGLTGMKMHYDHLIRPLLDRTRSEIEDYLATIGQDYVTDSSNQKADVWRNVLRLQVMPLLQGLNPSVRDTLCDTMARLTEVQKVYDASIHQTLERLVVNDTIGMEALHREPSPSAVLFEWLHPLGFNSTQIREALAWTADSTGRRIEADALTLLADRGRLCLLRPGDDTSLYIHTREISVSPDYQPSRQHDVADVDADTVQKPLTLRPVQDGDRFHPLGMKGTKLVNDLLTDLKMPLSQKGHQRVLVDASGRIVWVVGIRLDDRFRITPHTTRILRLTLEPAQPFAQ